MNENAASHEVGQCFFGLVRWQSVRVVPLDWLAVEDAEDLTRENLPLRCRCKWGPADQIVELIDFSDSKPELDQKLSKECDVYMTTANIKQSENTDTSTQTTPTSAIATTTIKEENGIARKRQVSRDGGSVLEAKRNTTTTATTTNNSSNSSDSENHATHYHQTLINVGYGADTSGGGGGGGRDTVQEVNGQSDSEYRQRLIHLSKQLEMERSQKLELAGMVQQLSQEIGMRKIELKETKLKLQILESFPRPTDTQLSFIGDLLSFYSHTSKPSFVQGCVKNSRSTSDTSERAEQSSQESTAPRLVLDYHSSRQPVQHAQINRSVIVSRSNGRSLADESSSAPPLLTTQPTATAVVMATTGGGGVAKVMTTAEGVPVPPLKTTEGGCFILAPSTAFSPHHHHQTIRMVTLPGNLGSPGGSSAGSKEGDEEAGSAESSEMGGAGGVDMYGTPYGRNGYSCLVTQDEKLQEEEAFRPGANKVELVPNSSVFIKISDLNAIEQTPKESPTALMRSLISTWYGGRLLASCSATKGISPDIKSAVFDYVKKVFPDAEYTSLQRALTSKCCEERRKIKKEFNVSTSPLISTVSSSPIPICITSNTYT